MIRAIAAIASWAFLILVLGPPILLLGLVHPSRRVAAWYTLFLSRVALWICGVKLIIEDEVGARSLGAAFFVGNHQSALDVPIVISMLAGDVRFFAKDTLFRFPIWGWLLRQYGYVAVNRSNPRITLGNINRVLSKMADDPISLAVFPEGTRSPDGRLLPFRKGTMKICCRAGLPVVPFAIDGAWRVNPRGGLKARPGSVIVRFAEPLSADRVRAMSADELHSTVRCMIGQLLDQREEKTPEHAVPWTAPEGV